MAGSCTVCLHVRRRQIDAYLKQNVNYGPILRWLREQKVNDQTVRTYTTKDPLKNHRENCLGLDPLPSSRGGVQAVVEVESTSTDVSPEEIGKRARMRLAAKLDQLSAKDLHTLVVESLKLEREKVKRRQDEGYDDEGEDDVLGAAEGFDKKIHEIGA